MNGKRIFIAVVMATSVYVLYVNWLVSQNASATDPPRQSPVDHFRKYMERSEQPGSESSSTTTAGSSLWEEQKPGNTVKGAARGERGSGVPLNHRSRDRWIVVTTIFPPTENIKYLSTLPGWAVVVVGDRKTPRDWYYPNCVYLSLEDQQSLHLTTVHFLPESSYARKNAGYLYAIANGAKVIYETDDDNRLTDSLKRFTLNPVIKGLMYNGDEVFNPYRHFGQPTLWPRGYPLSFVGENESILYLLGEWKTPSIQQGTVDGDPDLDAISRLMRKKTVPILNVTFDGRAPPGIVPEGVFSPFNSQNTLFLYDAFWALFIPTSTRFRVCDIWRGYWAQRLLWETGGSLAFFPPNAVQKRNSHSDFEDAVDEKDLYYKTDALISFLKQWKCGRHLSFFQCVNDLSVSMAEEGFWKVCDADLIKRWIYDLKQIGYKEPSRATTTSIRLKKTKVHFCPNEQTPPLKLSTNTGRAFEYSYLDRMMKFCPNVKFNVSFHTIHDSKVYSNILLIISISNTTLQHVQVLDLLYGWHFPNTVYCGQDMLAFESLPRQLGFPVTFIEVETGECCRRHCLARAMEMGYTVDGYLYVQDDTLLNVWSVGSLPVDKVWHGPLSPASPDQGPHTSEYRSTGSLVISETNGANQHQTNMVYIPYVLKNNVLDLLVQFEQSTLFDGSVFSSVIYWTINEADRVLLKGKHVDAPSDIGLFHQGYSFMYPLRFREIVEEKKYELLCRRVLPRILNKEQIN
ncbi:uncharacterized protein [Haliotis cracherodii]|uniref:uncharacterized protein n=1 Tax=Haliotis cracherodii TaxID=6455 RepID=UPI0039EA5DB7